MLPARWKGGSRVDDDARLIELNRQFIEGFRLGSWSMVDAILSPDFVYLDGVTGEAHDRAAYQASMTGPLPTLAVDEVGLHRSGDVAVVTGRTTRDGQVFRRYVDTWVRTDGDPGWTCIHGCLWPLPS
jgi:ketosteroid isomerase-like protein